MSLSYASRHPDQGLEPVHELARELDAVVEWSDLLHRYLLVSAGADDDAELEPPGAGGAGGAFYRGVGRRVVRGGLLRGAGPGADRDADAARSSRAAASPPTWIS